MGNNEPNVIDNINEYLEFIGSDKEYKAQMHDCEVCGSNEFVELLSHTDAGNNVLAPLPVQALSLIHI